jgi:hypothetical protein
MIVNKNVIRISITGVLLILVTYLMISISACNHKTPSNTDDICQIFSQKKRWHKYAKKSTKKWGTPVHVQMAILQQESGFKYDAKPARKKILGIIPWRRKSSAYGYAQVLNETWKEYAKQTKNHGADRDNFKDAIDFVGWYTYHTQKQTKISKWDAYNQYLAYHEGRGGFMKKSHNKKPWLVKVAKKVDSRAKIYASQLKRCQ